MRISESINGLYLFLTEHRNELQIVLVQAYKTYYCSRETVQCDSAKDFHA